MPTLDGVRTQLGSTEAGKAPEEAAHGSSRHGDDIYGREAGHLEDFCVQQKVQSSWDELVGELGIVGV